MMWTYRNRGADVEKVFERHLFQFFHSPQFGRNHWSTLSHVLKSGPIQGGTQRPLEERRNSGLYPMWHVIRGK